MSIIISGPGQKPQRLDPLEFDQETKLQELVHDNPESVASGRAEEQPLVLAREFPTEAGPIDALGFGAGGEIYVIETKLEKNPDRRHVVAQALDYGAALWQRGGDFAAFCAELDSRVREKFSVGLREKLADFFVLDDAGVSALLDAVAANLADGRFRFVVPMDRIGERLRDLVLFVNHNSRFDIHAVELEHYRHGDLGITIPRVFGAEVQKRADSPASGQRKHWTLDAVVADAREKLSGPDLAAFQKLLAFAEGRADDVRVGSGAYGSFSPVFGKLSAKSLFTACTDRRLSLNFEWVGRDNPATRDRLKAEMEKIGLPFRGDYADTRPSFDVSEWGPKVDAIIGAVTKMLES